MAMTDTLVAAKSMTKVRRRLRAFIVLAGLVALGACGTQGRKLEDPPPLAPQALTELKAWLAQHGKDPTTYVIDLFSEHDVVFLGENHRIKHDVLFVQSLLAPLYHAGVRTLATEFGRREDQTLIDSLVLAPEFDEGLAREILFRNFVFWGYREYVDVYRAAWALNRGLPKGAPRFRVLGINDSPDWSVIKTQADRDNPDIKKQVWRGGGESLWANVILDAVRSGEKVLVYCGIHHAFTQYRQPLVSKGEFKGFDSSLRCGNHVFAALGKRAVTVFLHAPWMEEGGYDSPFRHPADGVIDALMLAIGPRPVGFDLHGGPFGALRVVHAVYRQGYDPFTLGTFCDGWVYTKPISEYEGVTPIPGWINAGNLARARAQSPNPDFRKSSAEEFNHAIAEDAQVNSHWGRLR
jgi:hypothetical protein